MKLSRSSAGPYLLCSCFMLITACRHSMPFAQSRFLSVLEMWMGTKCFSYAGSCRKGFSEVKRCSAWPEGCAGQLSEPIELHAAAA